MLQKIETLFLIVFLWILQILPCTSQALADTYFESNYGRLKYGLYVPENYDEKKAYPLVMYLHGWNWTNSDYLQWYTSEQQTKTPCFVYTPKCPVDWDGWSGWNDYKLSEAMRTAIEMLDTIMVKYSIDSNRLYVYGISMGGEGVFDLLHKLPGKFAAAISICGGGQAWWAPDIAKTPLWMFHGSADDVNPPEITERVYYKLLEIGATKMRYTNYLNYGHEIWEKAKSEPSFYDWMFNFSKNDTICETPENTILLEGTVSDKITLKWSSTTNTADKKNKIWYYNIYNSTGIVASTEYDNTEYTFKPGLTIDTFRVNAVNYCFKQSLFSNPLFLNGDSIGTAILKTNQNKLRMVKKANSVLIDGFRGDEQNIVLKLISMEGKLMCLKKYSKQKNILFDLSSFGKGTAVLVVESDSETLCERVIR